MAITLGGDGGFVFVGGQNGGTSAGKNTTGAKLLTAFVSEDAGGGVSISDSNANTWVPGTAETGDQPDGRFFHVVNPTVGTGHTFTVAGSNTYSGVVFSWWDGADVSAPADQENGDAGFFTSGSNAQPGSVTPSTNGQLILCGYAGGPTSSSISDGLTVLSENPTAGGSYWGNTLGYLIQTTAAAINPLWTFSQGALSGSILIATFKASSGSGITLALTGVSATGAVGSVVPSTTVPLTGSVATGAVGSVSAASAGTAALTGVSATGALGSVTPSHTVALTGLAATGAVGTVTATGAGVAGLSGVTATGAVGSFGVSSTVGITGVAATGAVGTLGAGFGQSVSGVSATGAVGSVVPSRTVPITGATGTGAVGSVGGGGPFNPALALFANQIVDIDSSRLT